MLSVGTSQSLPIIFPFQFLLHPVKQNKTSSSYTGSVPGILPDMKKKQTNKASVSLVISVLLAGTHVSVPKVLRTHSRLSFWSLWSIPASHMQPPLCLYILEVTFLTLTPPSLPDLSSLGNNNNNNKPFLLQIPTVESRRKANHRNIYATQPWLQEQMCNSAI